MNLIFNITAKALGIIVLGLLLFYIPIFISCNLPIEKNSAQILIFISFLLLAFWSFKQHVSRPFHNTLSILIAAVLIEFTFFITIYLANINNIQIELQLDYSSLINLCLSKIMVAFHEEIIFRLFVLLFLMKLFKSKIIPIVISSMAFSSIHFWQTTEEHQWALLYFAFLFGIVACILFLYKHNIFLPILIHLIWNVLNEIILEKTFQTEKVASINLALPLVVLTLILIVLGYYKKNAIIAIIQVSEKEI